MNRKPTPAPVAVPPTNLFLIENGWVDYLNYDLPNLIKYCERDKKSYHGDLTLDVILDVDITDVNKLKEKRTGKLKELEDLGIKVYLINVYEKSYITGEPKVEKQSSLERIFQLAKEGDILLMNMELYRNGNNLPVTVDPASLKIVKQLIDKGVICVFPAGNACINLISDLEDPKSYLVVGALTKDVGGIIYSSNYRTEIEQGKEVDKLIYKLIPDERIKGLSHSSAASAKVTNECLNQRKEINKKGGDFKLETFIESIKTSNNKNKQTISYLNIKIEEEKPLQIKVTKEQFFKWKKELGQEYDEPKILSISKLMSPINRNIFPFPRKLKFEDNQHTGVSRTSSISILKGMLSKFKDAGFLGVKICYGINEDGDIILIVSGYFRGEIEIDETKNQSYYEYVFHTDQLAYKLNFDIDTKKELEELKKQYSTPDEFVEKVLETSVINPQEKRFLIKEFRKYYKNTETHGIIIGINFLNGLLDLYAKKGNDIIKIMIVTDSRKMADANTLDQEFGILVFNHDGGTNPVCFIKDRVLNQADDTHTCPPMPKCDEE